MNPKGPNELKAEEAIVQAFAACSVVKNITLATIVHRHIEHAIAHLAAAQAGLNGVHVDIFLAHQTAEFVMADRTRSAMSHGGGMLEPLRGEPETL